MDDTLLRELLQQSEQRNEALSRELASLRASFAQLLQEQQVLHRDHEALVDATRIITSERDALQQRAAELEAANKRLVDMLWGRRSERRSESPDQQQLDFGDEPEPPPSAAEQEIITAQDQADEARDRELPKRLEARRKARREQAQGREDFPPTIERRERILDLPEDQKQGLKPIGVKSTERLRFEKPHMYVEVIKRPRGGRPAGERRAEHAAAAVIDAYLEDVLRKLADAQQNHPTDLALGSSYLADLLPDRWAARHPQSVRQERVEDREMVFEARRLRRAKARLQARVAKTAAP